MENNLPRGYAKVIGSDQLVEIGTLNEKLFFAVKHLNSKEHKTFYLTPAYYPGYDTLVSTLKGQQVLAKWRKERQEAIVKLNLQDNFVIL
jgi:hypothetical protein